MHQLCETTIIHFFVTNKVRNHAIQHTEAKLRMKTFINKVIIQ